MDGSAEGKRCRRVLCQLLLHQDDRRVCVPYFLAGLYLAGENNVCMGVSVTRGWALPSGSSQQKRALAAPLCLFMCNLFFCVRLHFVFLFLLIG